MNNLRPRYRVFTCTPVDFAGDEGFFWRESGMFSSGLSSLGVISKSIMPGMARESDDPRLIRTDERNLRAASWWRSLDLDAVILYSWAAPRYIPVASAIKEAGIRLMVCMDTCGVVSPHSHRQAWFRDLPTRILNEHSWGSGRPRELLKYLIESVASPLSRARIRHFQCADVITVPTPEGTEWVRNEARILGGEELAERFRYQPHPQASDFRYDGTPKEKLVVSVARWNPEDWGQKNPHVLLSAYRKFLKMMPDWNGLVIGSGATRLSELLGIAPIPGLKFLERMDPTDMPALFNRASIGFWSSRWEGQQGTGAQALCCGCSVVSHGSPMMSCFRHYVSRKSGSLASSNTSEAHAAALACEARAWDSGERSPSGISSSWTGEFHAESVARMALEYLGLNPVP